MRMKLQSSEYLLQLPQTTVGSDNIRIENKGPKTWFWKPVQISNQLPQKFLLSVLPKIVSLKTRDKDREPKHSNARVVNMTIAMD